MSRRLLTGIGMVSISIAAFPAGVMDIDGELWGARNSNLSNGSRSTDRRADSSIGAAATLSRTRLMPRSALTYGARAEGNKFGTFDALDNTAITGFAQWSFQPVRGFTAPWLEAGIQHGVLRHQGSALRDGNQTIINLGVARRFSDHAKAALSLERELRTSKVSGFDTQQTRLKLSSDLQVSEKGSAYVSLGVGSGTFVTSSYGRCNTSYSGSLDPAVWGTGDLSTCYVGCHEPPKGCVVDAAVQSSATPEMFAFKLHGQQRDVGLGYRHNLDSNSRLEINFNSARTTAGDFQYRRNLLQANLLKRF